MTKDIKIGDEFITKNRSDANGGYILTIKNIRKFIPEGHQEYEPDNDFIDLSTQDMKYTKSGQSKIKENTHEARRWWINEWCLKIKR